MLPFAFLTLKSKYFMQSVIITSLWISSFLYHLILTFSKQEKTFFALDIIFQAVLLILTLNLIKDQCTKHKLPIKWNFLLVSLTGLILYFTIYKWNKPMIFVGICACHIIMGILGYMYACDRKSIIIAMIFFIMIIMIFILDGKSLWPIAHILLLFYIYYYWKSFNLLKTSESKN